MSEPIEPKDLPDGAFLRAVVSFANNPYKKKGQKDEDLKVKCILIKHRNADKYTIHPYIDVVTRYEKLKYRNILCVWEYEPVPTSDMWLKN